MHFLKYSVDAYEVFTIKKCKKKPHFAIVLDGVKKDVFPEVFRRRIRSLYYQEMQETPHITIVLDGVKEDGLPEVFRRRIHERYPGTFHSDDDDAQRIVGLVLDEEPLCFVW